jgi:hypothetical protein
METTTDKRMRYRRSLDRYKGHCGWLLFLLEWLQRPVLLGFDYNNEPQQWPAKVLGQMVTRTRISVGGCIVAEWKLGSLHKDNYGTVRSVP